MYFNILNAKISVFYFLVYLSYIAKGKKYQWGYEGFERA
jgi:hypothetical protein